MRGSPPRGRGKVRCSVQLDVCHGITPAWAGKRQEFLALCDVAEDHPRVGGEKFPRSLPVSRLRGSPPRGRGKDSVMYCLQGVHGITPAWAGKRHHRAPKRVKRKDHPRVGGEKPAGVKGALPPLGSPPRGRGKVPVLRCRTVCRRITPAWAGKSNNQPTAPGVCGDHPRVGGEKSRVAPRSDPGTGSPPRGRGKVNMKSSRVTLTRITPAWAGKRSYCSERLRNGGITPAWAGKRKEEFFGNRIVQDHPRVGGEKW